MSATQPDHTIDSSFNENRDGAVDCDQGHELELSDMMNGNSSEEEEPSAEYYFHSSTSSGDSSSTEVYENETREQRVIGMVRSLRLRAGSDHTEQSATFIPSDLLMLPTVNRKHTTVNSRQTIEADVEQASSRDPTATETPEQFPVVTKPKTYKYRISLLECQCLPRYIRTAPIWVKGCIVLSVCAILFGLCLYMAAIVLQDGDNQPSDDSDGASASDILLHQDAAFMAWVAEQEATAVPTASDLSP